MKRLKMVVTGNCRLAGDGSWFSPAVGLSHEEPGDMDVLVKDVLAGGLVIAIPLYEILPKLTEWLWDGTEKGFDVWDKEQFGSSLRDLEAMMETGLDQHLLDCLTQYLSITVLHNDAASVTNVFLTSANDSSCHIREVFGARVSLGVEVKLGKVFRYELDASGCWNLKE